MPTLTNVYEIVIKGTVPTTGSGTKNIFNVFHYAYISAGSPDTPSVVLTQFLTGPWANIAGQLSITYTGVESDCRKIDDATQQFITGATPASGTVTGARLPSSSTVRMLLRGATRGKNFRGAKNFGPVAQSQVLNDELIAAADTAWQTVAATMLLNLVNGANQYAPVVLSKSLSQLRVNPTTIIGTTLVSILVNKTIGNLRHRKEKTVR